MTSIVEAVLTFSASMTEQEFIERMSKLPPHRWRYVAGRGSAFQRKPGASIKMLPDELIAVVPLLRDVEEWERVRKRINSLRRQIHRAKTKEISQRRREARRAYMRDYMTRYRSK